MTHVWFDSKEGPRCIGCGQLAESVAKLPCSGEQYPAQIIQLNGIIHEISSKIRMIEDAMGMKVKGDETVQA